jgi:hypothetical protein
MLIRPVSEEKWLEMVQELKSNNLPTHGETD